MRNELSSGVRLPSPPFCPSSNSALIQNCFQEKPQERPNFKLIKQAIQNAYVALISDDESTGATQGINSTPPVYLHLSPIGQTTSNEMMDRYKRVKNENKRKTYVLKPATRVVNNNCGQVELNPILSTATFTNVPDRYASLQHITSNITQPLESLQYSYNIMETTSIYKPISVKSSRYLKLSPASNELKSFYSYAGEDIWEKEDEELVEEREARTQSWNPLYMMQKLETRV